MTEDQMKKLKPGVRVQYMDGSTGTVTKALTLNNYLEIAWDDGTSGQFHELDRRTIKRMKFQDKA